MKCSQCGADLPDGAKFCHACGEEQEGTVGSGKGKSSGRVGYSEKIHDPAFQKYLKNTNRWSSIFAGGLAVIAVVGFFIAGETGAGGMENPESLYIGLGLGGMFLAIAFFQILGRKRSSTWDGVVTDRVVKQKRRKQSTGGDKNDYRWVNYTEYTVEIRSDSGKKHSIVVDDDDTLYNYYQVGDRVRHHGGLNSFEKYDKSRDSIIFCNACATKCDIGHDVCFRCGCPLLK